MVMMMVMMTTTMTMTMMGITIVRSYANEKNATGLSSGFELVYSTLDGKNI